MIEEEKEGVEETELKTIKITKETHKEFDVLRANLGLKTFNCVISTLLDQYGGGY